VSSLTTSATAPVAQWPQHIFEQGKSEGFRAQYNVSPFVFGHHLGNHPLFAIDPLVELCSFLEKQPLKDRVVHFTDDAKLNQAWRRSKRGALTATEALANIRDSHSWILMKDIQRCSLYADLPDSFVDEIERLSGASMRSDITWMDMYLFIASPGMTTPYHIDHECNFLLQIHGEKTAHVFPPADRSVLTEQEIERYYAGDLNAAQYREAIEAKALEVRLQPGVGVHQPPLAPHWVKNGKDYSVSLSFLYFLRPFDHRAKVYQTNYLLRTLGLRPTPPGVSKLKDATKAALLSDFGYRPRRKEDVVRHAFRRATAPVRWGRKLRSFRT
jgi:hypothetical protein